MYGLKPVPLKLTHYPKSPVIDNERGKLRSSGRRMMKKAVWEGR
jgi:hypothetical protein